MRVLFVASNPPDSDSLVLEREITELQRRFADASGEPVAFKFLPGLRIQALPKELNDFKPDILHISAHGDEEALALASDSGRVELAADSLVAFLPRDPSPRLVYLNACNSVAIATKLSRHVDLAIGTTAPIRNGPARDSAVTFYERVLSGHSVQKAFNVAKNMLQTTQPGASFKLRNRPGVDPDAVILHRLPKIVAEFVNKLPPAGTNRQFQVRFGLTGCPINTVQVVFFTDHEKFIDPEIDDLQCDLSVIVRGRPKAGVMWADKESKWSVKDDFSIYAAGVTADNKPFVGHSLLTDAVRQHYSPGDEDGLPRDVARAIIALKKSRP